MKNAIILSGWMLIYIFLKLEACLAIMAKALKRSAKLLLRSLLCIRFMKEEELSASHASNRKDAQYFQKLSGAWGKGSIMHTANLASAC